MRCRHTAVLVGAASVVVLSAVPVSTALAKSLGSPATPNAATPPPKSLTVTGGSVAGLAPGTGPLDLGVVVSNPKQNSGSVRLASVVARVTSTVPDGCTVGVIDPGQGTDSYDIVITNYRPPAGTGVVLDRNDSGKAVPLSIQAYNRSQDQEPCKGLQLALSYTATAAGK